MITHLLLPGVNIETGFSHPVFERYLRQRREDMITDADDGVVSASICLQGIFIELILDGELQHDWLSIMSDLLTDAQRPVAYSKNYGKQLHKFGEQYLQSTVHAIHTRWWVEKLAMPKMPDHEKFAKMILAKKCTDGLIYDADVSNTVMRHRMKSELSMSAAMGAEILFHANYLTDVLRDEMAADLCDPRKVPPLDYIISEQYRLAALRILSHEEQFPKGIEKRIDACAEGLAYGWNDFSMASKKDAYMGTAKRTAHDKPIHSPLVACHVAALSDKVEDIAKRTAILERLNVYALKLAENPLDIPSFQMRDIPIPFGTGITPIEAICASWLIANHQNGGPK
jgi:hypothetical protein